MRVSFVSLSHSSGSSIPSRRFFASSSEPILFSLRSLRRALPVSSISFCSFFCWTVFSFKEAWRAERVFSVSSRAALFFAIRSRIAFAFFSRSEIFASASFLELNSRSFFIFSTSFFQPENSFSSLSIPVVRDPTSPTSFVFFSEAVREFLQTIAFLL